MKKILLIDDDKVFQKTTGDYLKAEGYDVNVANDGKEGLKKVEENQPDLILLDLMMPNMGGMDFAKEIQNNDNHRNIPILIVSNFNNISHINEGLTSGARGYIIKSEESLKTISNAVESIVGRPE